MKVLIFVEGGGNNVDTLKRCKSGFGEYCKKLAPVGKLPKVIPCGGRQQAFEDYKSALGQAKKGELCALLVDSEGAVGDGLEPMAHLAKRDGWSFVGLDASYVFVMVQAMEAWFLADRAALVEYFGKDFRLSSLPGSEKNVEPILKQDLVPSLEAASKDLKDGGYHKTRNAFTLLGLIDPAKVEAGSPRAAKFHKFLREL